MTGLFTRSRVWPLSAALCLFFIITDTSLAKTEDPMLTISGKTYVFDARTPLQSGRVGFQVDSSGGRIRGSTTRVSGALTGDSAKRLTHGQIRIDATALDTGNSVFNKFTHGDVLETHRFPEVLLEISDIAVTGDNTGRLTGRLTLHGTTRALQVPCTISVRNGSTLEFVCTATLNLTDYGAKPYRIPLIFNMEDRVEFRFEFSVQADVS